MLSPAVVAFARIFHDQFPIGALYKSCRMGNLCVTQVVRPEQRLNPRSDWRKIGRGFAEAHENDAGDALSAHGTQAVRLRIKTFLHSARAQQLAVKIVGPLMIRAYQPTRMAPLFGANLCATMPATIEKCTDAASLVAQYYDRRKADRHGDVIARLWNFDFKASLQPIAIENRLKIEIENGRFRVQRLRQRVTGRALGKQRLHPICDRHTPS